VKGRCLLLPHNTPTPPKRSVQTSGTPPQTQVTVARVLVVIGVILLSHVRSDAVLIVCYSFLYC
jgi:hypothetical protein